MKGATLPLRFACAIFIATFVHSVLQPGWASVAVFTAGLVFSGFLLWVNPGQGREVSADDFDKLKEQVATLRDQLTATRMKIGFR